MDAQQELNSVQILLNRCNNDILNLKNENQDLERKLSDALSTGDLRNQSVYREAEQTKSRVG